MTPCKSQLTRSRAAAAAPLSAWFSYLHCCRAVARRQELSNEGDAAERAKRAAGGFLLLFPFHLFVTFKTGTLPPGEVGFVVRLHVFLLRQELGRDATLLNWEKARLENPTEALCFERPGLPPEQQISAFPDENEPASYFRGALNGSQVGFCPSSICNSHVLP